MLFSGLVMLNSFQHPYTSADVCAFATLQSLTKPYLAYGSSRTAKPTNFVQSKLDKPAGESANDRLT